MGTSRAAAFTVQNSDLLIVLGNRLPSIVTGVDFCKFARDAKTYVIDIDKTEHSKESIKGDTFIHAELAQFFDFFKDDKSKVEKSEWNIKTQLYVEKHFFSRRDFQ